MKLNHRHVAAAVLVAALALCTMVSSAGADSSGCTAAPGGLAAQNCIGVWGAGNCDQRHAQPVRHRHGQCPAVGVLADRQLGLQAGRELDLPHADAVLGVVLIQRRVAGLDAAIPDEQQLLVLRQAEERPDRSGLHAQRVRSDLQLIGARRRSPVSTATLIVVALLLSGCSGGTVRSTKRVAGGRTAPPSLAVRAHRIGRQGRDVCRGRGCDGPEPILPGVDPGRDRRARSSKAPCLDAAATTHVAYRRPSTSNT